MNIALLKRTYLLHILGSLFLIFSLVFRLSPTNAQDFLLSSLTQDELIVSVNNIAIDGELTLRGLTADFPYPILSTISVVDSQANIVIGLADTLRWLAPDDIAEIGLPISEIWQPILEYHQEDPSIPGDPDLYHQSPSPLVTEVRKTVLLPTSTMLVMDVSGSMRPNLDNAKEGALLYIDLFRSVDRGGIIQFSDSIKTFVEMTNDTSVLKEAIRDAEAGGRTALYDAIMAAIEGTKLENGRRGIIAYTDGQDNNSDTTKNTPEAIIDSAGIYNLPIYTIALGDSTREDKLKQIADQTGGIFFKAATAEEMKTIYAKLSVLMQNYYVMAHASPDPRFNKTWRLVDVTANIPAQNGRGIGRYFVGGPPPIQTYDLAIKQMVFTDTTIVLEGDTVQAVLPGDRYSYRLTIDNLGPGMARNFIVWDVFPDLVTISDFNIQPTTQTVDTLFWQFDSLLSGNSVTITFNATVADSLPFTPFPLVNTSGLAAENDTSAENNIVSTTVYAIPRPEVQAWQPFIEARPPTVEVGNSVSVRVQVSGPVKSWDLWVYLPDGQIDSTYADGFIVSTQLVPDIWSEVEPKYAVTRMFTQSVQEQITFELRAVDTFGIFKSASAPVTVQSKGDFNVDRNIFAPDQENDLAINFKLSSDSEARLDIYDITGTKITKLTEAQFKAGWNTYYWNGLTENGQKIGSGFYIITLRAGGYYAWKKLMIVR